MQRMGGYLLQILIIFALGAASLKCCTLNDIHAIILARGGSKGIKSKNMLTFNGTTLLGQTIKTLAETNKFSAIWVSTDDKRIAQEAIKNGALVYKRMSCFAEDHSSSLDAIKEFLYTHFFVNRFALFQCTSIFLKKEYITEAVKKFQNSPCVFAVKRTHKLKWIEQNLSIKPLNFDPKRRPRRQDWRGELEETGMFYFSNRLLVSKNLLQSERCSVVEIESIDSIEIDSPNDYEMAKCILNIKKRINDRL
ncbi:N-acylneuraminate cytidylyltransferase A [Musca domestica]|uniref:N-acylneuraminate cytidylyltransferase A n=1 Tax=Musca domestica TaxID=7370 RepID=A0ABM3VPQ8_MUSDO|nr:N-acylneuraminate cytidylyltransferase A [Musca domestica]